MSGQDMRWVGYAEREIDPDRPILFLFECPAAIASAMKVAAPARHAAVAGVAVARGGGANGLAVHARQVQAWGDPVQLPLQRLQLQQLKICIFIILSYLGKF